MKVHSHGMTDRGLVRQNNEDAFFLDDTNQVYAVADGLGGLPGGKEASRRAVELLEKSMSSINGEEERFDLNQLILGINKVISREALEAYPLTGSGSTLTLCQLVGDQLLIGHVGDSAVYLLRDEIMEKLTTDHTLEQEFIERLGEDARKNMPDDYPHTLTRCVGQQSGLVIEEVRKTIQSGDRVLLCTDGLNKVVEEDFIAETLASYNSAEEISRTLTQKALNLHGPDNITTITLLIE